MLNAWIPEETLQSNIEKFLCSKRTKWPNLLKQHILGWSSPKISDQTPHFQCRPSPKLNGRPLSFSSWNVALLFGLAHFCSPWGRKLTSRPFFSISFPSEVGMGRYAIWYSRRSRHGSSYYDIISFFINYYISSWELDSGHTGRGNWTVDTQVAVAHRSSIWHPH